MREVEVGPRIDVHSITGQVLMAGLFYVSIIIKSQLNTAMINPILQCKYMHMRISGAIHCKCRKNVNQSCGMKSYLSRTGVI